MAQVTVQAPGIAESLYRMGYTDLVSVERGGKRPALLESGSWKGYSWNTEVDVLFAGRMDRDKSNIGIRASRFPGLDIDSDDEQLTNFVLGVAWQYLKAANAPVRRSTGNRALLMFRTEVPFKKKKLTITLPNGENHAVEMLADGQQYVIQGPHPSGSKYGFRDGSKLPLDPLDLPLVDEEMVDNFFLVLGELLAAQGISSTMATAPAGERQPIPDEISEGERSDQLIRLAGGMRRQNADYETILAALVSMNETRCFPPLDDEDVQGIARSAMRYDAEPDAIKPKATDVFQPVEVVEKPREKHEFVKTTGGEMPTMVVPEQMWLLDGMIPRSESSLLLAKPKVGKSTFARALAVAVATGQDFLGREVESGPVIYVMFPNEGSKREAKTEFGRLGLYDHELASNLHFWYDPPPDMTKDEMILDLAMDAAAIRPTLIVIDTLQGIVQAKDLNDYSGVHRALKPLGRIAQASGSHLMYLHHEPKGQRNEYADPIEAALGSTALGGSVDAAMRIVRDEEEHQTRYLAVRGREGIEFAPHVLGVDPDTHIPFLGAEATSHRNSGLQNEVLTAFREIQGEAKAGDIRAITGHKTKTVYEALKALVDQGAVIRTGNGSTTRYQLANPHDVFKPEEVEGPDAE